MNYNKLRASCLLLLFAFFSISVYGSHVSSIKTDYQELCVESSALILKFSTVKRTISTEYSDVSRGYQNSLAAIEAGICSIQQEVSQIGVLIDNDSYDVESVQQGILLAKSSILSLSNQLDKLLGEAKADHEALRSEWRSIVEQLYDMYDAAYDLIVNENHLGYIYANEFNGIQEKLYALDNAVLEDNKLTEELFYTQKSDIESSIYSLIDDFNKYMETASHEASITAKGGGYVSYSNTVIRNTTKTFTVTNGDTVILSLFADNGYRVKSVLLNGSAVNYSDNQVVITNVTSAISVEVEFVEIPPETYTLSVKATGNGSAVYNSETIRNTTKAFTVTKGAAVTISFLADDGYRVKSVLLNGSAVSYSNNQLTVSNITSATSVEVDFEEIPLEKYSLSIKATGDGSAVYNSETIRNTTKTFTVTKGTFVTISFLADDCYRVKNVMQNGSAVSYGDNQVTINNITSAISVEVIFEPRPSEFSYQNVNYVVASFASNTVRLAKGNYGKVLEVQEKLYFEGEEWTVVGVDGLALDGNEELAAIIWKPKVPFTARLANPNLLLYVEEAAYAPTSIGNVVVKGVADNIVLTDATSGNDFFCPQEFTARQISYSHRYSMETGMDEARGWETIALPFDVQRIVHKSKGEIVPFAQQSGGDGKRPFWLMTFTDKGWAAADGIMANTPYIISMPNHPDYYSNYLLSGTVTFESENVTVKSSDNLKHSQQGNKTFIPTYSEIGMGEGAFAMNVSNDLEQNTSGVAEGSRFVLNMRRVHPFEAYMKSSSTRSPWIDIDEDMNDTSSQADGRIAVFTPGGQLLRRGADEAEALRTLRSGVYIMNRKKIIVK